MNADEQRLKNFICGVTWIFAKTYAETAPHEYIVYNKLRPDQQKEYEWFVKQIKQHGVDEKFYQAPFRYLYFEEMKYWVNDLEELAGGVLNRDWAKNKYK